MSLTANSLGGSLLLLGLITAGCAAEAPKVGDVVFETGFEAAAERDAWSKADFATWEPGWMDGTSLKVTVPATGSKAGSMISRPLDLTRYRGCRLLLTCQAKANGVSKPSASYLGVKFMLHYKAPSGEFWGNQNDVFGTFEWKPLTFTATLPDDVTTGELSLGLQDCAGTVWFDALRLTVSKLPPPKRPAPALNPPPAYKGHTLPRLRGVMSPNQYRDEDLRVLGQEWHANLIRWQITRAWGKLNTDTDLAEYDKWLDSKMADLDQTLVACQKYGIKVVIDLHSPPGGRTEGSEMRMFHELPYQDHFVKVWERMARRYRGNPAVWGYDLVNEPVQNRPSPEGVADYLGAQEKAAKAIRKIDPTTPIIIESNNWDSASGFKDLQPIDVPNVVYQVHMYDPGQFTHQGVHGPSGPVVYPGQIGGLNWDKEQIRRNLAPVREFQLAYNVHIYAGEFSAIRWAPGAAAYLRDVISVFEEYGWDWTYHAYREWDGWSLEHGPNKDDHQPTAQPTDRKQVVLGWFGKNQRAE